MPWVYLYTAVYVFRISGGYGTGGSMSGNKKPEQNEFARALSMLLQIGVTIIACLAVGIFLGWLLDRFFGTAPWLLMVCTFLGIGAAFKSIFDFAKKV